MVNGVAYPAVSANSKDLIAYDVSVAAGVSNTLTEMRSIRGSGVTFPICLLATVKAPK